MQRRRLPRTLFGLALAYLVFAWMISYLGDVHGFLSLGHRLALRGAERPFVWYYLFMEGSPTEMLQWGYLALAAGTCFYLSGGLRRGGYRGPSHLFVLLGVGTTLMLLEDAGNLRHQIKFYARLALGTDSMALGMGIEFAFFGLLGAVMIYALYRYWRFLWVDRVTRAYTLVGYSAYALASLASVTRHIGSWYDRAGAALLRTAGVLEAFEASFVPTQQGRPIGFYIMDFLLEESLELIGAAALAAAFLAYKLAFDRGDRVTVPFKLSPKAGSRERK